MKIRIPHSWMPREYQLPVWRYLQQGGRHVEKVWHRRGGKDEVDLQWTNIAAHKRRGNYWYMLPQYNQARKAIWDAINPHTGKKRIDEAFPPALRKRTRDQQMMIELKIGSSWQVVGSDNPDSLVGSPPVGIVYSEWALSNPATRAYLRPMLLENGGWQIYNTTPRGRNHAYRTFTAAQKNPESFAQLLSAHDTDVFTQAQLDQELQNYIDEFGLEYGTAKFEQEYLCSWDAANLGSILARQLSENERKGLINPDVDFDPFGPPMIISADIGHSDTSTWWFWQARVGGYAVFDYDQGWGLNADQWAERIHDKISKYDRQGASPLGKIWLPHDARNKTFAANHSAVETFVKAFGSQHVAITPDSKIPDRVNAARLIAQRTEFNSDRCEAGLEALRAWQYEWRDENRMFSDKPLHDWASHAGDAYSYGSLIMHQAAPPKKIEPARTIAVGHNTATLDDLWATAKPRRNDRI